MEVKELQKRMVEFMNRWDKARNSPSTTDARFIHLVEEVGELARQYVNQKSRPGQYDEAEIKNAIGDITLQLVKIADIHGFDMEELILEVLRDDEPRLREEEKNSR